MKYRLSRVIRIVALAVFGLGVIAIPAAVAVYEHPRYWLEAYLKHRYNREASVGDVTIRFHPMVVEVNDVHIANTEWGTKEDMITVGHVRAEPEMVSFFKLRFRKVEIDHAAIFLERNEQGIGNWKKSGTTVFIPRSPRSDAHKRRHFPTLLNAHVSDSKLVMRTTKGHILTIDFKTLDLHTDDETQPVVLTVNGSYNQTPVQVDMETGSYDALHNVHAAFPMNIKAKAATAVLSGQLQAMDPLNFDQLTGPARIDIADTGEATVLIGKELNWNVPLVLEGMLQHYGDDWTASDAHGSFASSPFSGSVLHLTEGKRKQPDFIKAELHFKAIDMAKLLPPKGPSAAKKKFYAKHMPVDNPPLLLDGMLTAQQVSYGKVSASQVAGHVKITEGESSLDSFSARLFGGALHASVNAKTDGKSNDVTLTANLAHAQAQQAVLAIGITKDTIKSEANGQLSVQAHGSSIQQWLQTMKGELHLSLKDGMISRHLVEVVSTDIRTLVGSDPALIAMPCMVSQVKFTNDIGILSPFQATTAEGILLGAGTINMPNQRYDLTFRTDHKTTSVLALDIPVHIGGTFAAPLVLPSTSSKADPDFSESQNAKCAK